MYSVKWNKYIEEAGERVEEEYGYQLKIDSREGEIELSYLLEKEMKVPLDQLDYLLKELVFDCDSHKLKNIESVMKTWETEKKKIFFDQSNPTHGQVILEMSSYLDTSNCLEFMVKNYGVTPLLLLFNKYKDGTGKVEVKNYPLYDVFFVENPFFDLTLDIDQEKTSKVIKLKGIPGSQYNSTEHRAKLRSAFELTPDIIINPTFNIDGEAFYQEEDNFFSKITFSIVMNIRDGYELGYRVEVQRDEN